MKDFNVWNNFKKDLETVPLERFHFHEREIWWCSIGINVGDEQDGKNQDFERPVLVLRKFNTSIAWVLPMTTQPKQGIYYFPLSHRGEMSWVILSQLRLISVKRFRRYVRKITPHQFEIIRSRIIGLIKPY